MISSRRGCSKKIRDSNWNCASWEILDDWSTSVCDVIKIISENAEHWIMNLKDIVSLSKAVANIKQWFLINLGVWGGSPI